jgi:hypothetical protein
VIAEAVVIYKLMKKIATPFRAWEAYRRGIIDDRGRVLKKRSTLRSQADRDAWGIGDVFAANLKKVLAGSRFGSAFLGAAAVAAMLREDELCDSLENQLDEEVPTNSSSGGQVAATQEPMLTAKRRRIKMGKILSRKPVVEGPAWLDALERVWEEHDADLFSNTDRDEHYHPAVRFKGKEYHSERPDWHADIVQRIQAKHRLTDDEVSHHIEKGTMEMGLRHKRTGKTVWQYGG